MRMQTFNAFYIRKQYKFMNDCHIIFRSTKLHFSKYALMLTM